MITCVLLAGLSGCEDECGPDCAPARGSDDTAAMVYAVETPEPAWTAEELGAELEAFTALGAPNPAELGEVFLAAMQAGDENCPGENVYALETAPEGCDTEDGYHFAGIGWFQFEDFVQGEDGEPVVFDFSHGGDFEILRPDGTRLAGGGGIAYSSELGEGETDTSIELHGSWIDDARRDWLGVGFSGVYEAAVHEAGPEHWSFAIDGGLGLGGRILSFDDVSWDVDACPDGSPRGTFAMRDDRGYWTAWDVGDDCDGCGTVTFHDDVDLGELCLDLSAWGRLLYYMSIPR